MKHNPKEPGAGLAHRSAPSHHDSHPLPPSRGRVDLSLFLAIAAVAFGLRLLYVLQLRNSPLFDAPQVDSLYHDQWARAIVAGEHFVEGPYFRAPLYPYFLAAVYKIFGEGYLAPRIVQSVLGSLSCGLVFLIGRQVFSRSIGAVAGLATASYWILIYFDAELLIPSLIVILDLAMVLLLLRARVRPGRVRYGLAGMALGLSAIGRPNVLLFGPAVVVWLGIAYRPAWKRAITYAASFGLGCLVPVLPVTVRNYVVGNDFVLIASQGGVNFYIGNNPESDGTRAIVPGTLGSWWGGHYDTIAQAEKALGRDLRDSEVSDYYYHQAWVFIRTQPARALALLARKFWLFWNVREMSNNKNIYFWTGRFTPIVAYLPLHFGWVGPFGILGLACCWRRRRELFPIWGFILVYMVSVVLFFCTARYRVPVLGLLILLATYALLRLVASVRNGRWRELTGALALFGAAAVFVNAVEGEPKSTKDAQSLRLLALAYREHGRLDLACEYYRQAVELAPESLSARYDLGTILAVTNHLPEAIEQFHAALALADRLGVGETMASVAQVHHNLASVYREIGDLEQAARHYRRAIDVGPDGGTALTWFTLGLVLEASRDYAEAEAAFREAVRRDSDHGEARYHLAWLLSRSGRMDDAVVQLREAHRVRPDDSRIVLVLSTALMERGEYAEALTLLGGAADSGDAPVINSLAWLLATCPDKGVRDGARALRLAESLCPEATPCSPHYLDTLAAALAEAGQFERAVDVAGMALERARAAKDAPLASLIEGRLRRYEAGEPFHQVEP